MDDQEGRVNWKRTSTINTYTGERNYIQWHNACHAIVFRRAYGWAYTVRAKLTEGRWLQLSTDTQKHFKYLEDALSEASREASLMMNTFGDLLVPVPEPELNDDLVVILKHLREGAYENHRNRA